MLKLKIPYSQSSIPYCKIIFVRISLYSITSTKKNLFFKILFLFQEIKSTLQLR